MLHNFNLLPVELQADVIEMRELGASEDFIDRHVGRMLGALEAKSNKIQIDVWQIEERLSKRIDQHAEKHTADIQSQFGATNGMLVAIRTSVQTQEAAVIGLRAEFHDGMQSLGERISDNTLHIADLEDWRSEVDRERASFRQSRDESKEQRTRTEHAVTELAAQFERFVSEIHTLIAEGPTAEQAASYRAFLDNLMREREAGG